MSRRPDTAGLLDPGFALAVMFAASLERLVASSPPRHRGDAVMDLMVLPSSTSGLTSAQPPARGRKTEDLLCQSGYLAHRDVTCVVSDGVLYLRGRVPSYYLKQVAQEIAAGVEGVRLVINRIEVIGPAGNRLARDEQPPGPASPSA
jgi:hypothetical protein